MRWIRYQEVENQVKCRNWIAFLAPYAYVPFLLNIFLISAKFVPLFIKYDLDALAGVEDEEVKFLYTHLVTGLVFLYLLLTCIKSKRSIPNEARSYIMIPYQQNVHRCCIIMATTSALLSLLLCSNIIPHSVVMEQGILSDLLLSMYSGSILMGFLASHSFYNRDSALAPFNLILRIVIAFIVSVLPAVKLMVGSEHFTSYQLQFVSAVLSAVLYSDFVLRLYQCDTVHRYIYRKLHRPLGLSLIGLQTDHSLITTDRYATAQIISPITYIMNLGDYQAGHYQAGETLAADAEPGSKPKIHSDFIVREAAASLNNLAIVHQCTFAFYSCISWYALYGPCFNSHIANLYLYI